MNKKEIRKLLNSIMWTSVKPIPTSLDYCAHGYLSLLGTTKGGRILSLILCGVITIPAPFTNNKEYFEEKKKALECSFEYQMQLKLEERSGYKNYKGYFQIVKFEKQ